MYVCKRLQSGLSSAHPRPPGHHKKPAEPAGTDRHRGLIGLSTDQDANPDRMFVQEACPQIASDADEHQQRGGVGGGGGGGDIQPALGTVEPSNCKNSHKSARFVA